MFALVLTVLVLTLAFKNFYAPTVLQTVLRWLLNLDKKESIVSVINECGFKNVLSLLFNC